MLWALGALACSSTFASAKSFNKTKLPKAWVNLILKDPRVHVLANGFEMGRASGSSPNAAKVASIMEKHRTRTGNEVECYVVIDKLDKDGGFSGYFLRKVWRPKRPGQSRKLLRVELWDDAHDRDSLMRGKFQSWALGSTGEALVTVIDDTTPGLTYRSLDHWATVTLERSSGKTVLRGKVASGNPNKVRVRIEGKAGAIPDVRWLIEFKNDIEKGNLHSEWNPVSKLKGRIPNSIATIVERDLTFARDQASNPLSQVQSD